MVVTMHGSCRMRLQKYVQASEARHVQAQKPSFAYLKNVVGGALSWKEDVVVVPTSRIVCVV